MGQTTNMNHGFILDTNTSIILNIRMDGLEVVANNNNSSDMVDLEVANSNNSQVVVNNNNKDECKLYFHCVLKC